MSGDRYAEIASWYDEFASASAESSRVELAELLGQGEGRCLDLGCGTGLYLDAIEATGRTAVGLDFSGNQLAIARSRSTRLVRGDAACLPFPNDSFSAVAAVWVTTDLDEFGSSMREVCRVLVPGGRLVIYGVHPCFNGPFVETRDDGSRRVHPGYRVAGRYHSAPWWSGDGIRSRVGMRHLPLPDLFNGVIEAGLHIEKVAEPREEPIPFILALLANKPLSGSDGHDS